MANTTLYKQDISSGWMRLVQMLEICYDGMAMQSEGTEQNHINCLYEVKE